MDVSRLYRHVHLLERDPVAITLVGAQHELRHQSLNLNPQLRQPRGQLMERAIARVEFGAQVLELGS